MRLYFDGQIEATVPQTGKIDTPAENLLLGTFGGEKFIGKLDEVAIYNKALTEEEIKQLIEKPITAVQLKSKLSTTWGEIKR